MNEDMDWYDDWDTTVSQCYAQVYMVADTTYMEADGYE